ncbi:MAG: hypothetical protein M3N18_09390 [Actinomycetota bacterium]|nr:hypothetical protein [Actinomycetota bacterium]
MSEYVQFALLMVLFIAILIGSYYFVVVTPVRSAREQQAEGEDRWTGL